MLLSAAVAAALQAACPPRASASEPIPLSSESIREIPAEHYVGGLAFGDEGGVWYGDNGSELLRVTATGIPTGDFKVKFGEYLNLPETEAQSQNFVTDLTAGSDGGMWFIDDAFNNEPSQLLGRISPVGKTLEYEVEGATGSVQGLAAGPDAKIWFTVDEFAGAIKRIGESGEVEAFFPKTGSASNLPKESRPEAITSGPDGNMWFIDDGTNDEGHNLVGRVTPSGEIKEYPLPGELLFEQWIVAGPGGDVWIGTLPGTVYRVAPNGEVTSFHVPRSGEIQGLASGPEGDVWYVAGGFLSGSILGRLAPNGEATLFEPIGLSSNLEKPALGPDGEIWFTSGTSMFALKPPLAPVSISAPAIEGEAVEGAALTASPGEWQNDAALSFRWSLCDAAGAGCEALVGQEGRSIALSPFDVGHTLSVTVTASGPGGSATMSSSPSAVIRSVPIVSHQGSSGASDSGSSVTPDVGETTAPQVSSPPAPTLGTTMTWEFGWSHLGTKVKSLRLQSVPPGAELEVRCRGAACPFGRRRLRALSAAAFRKCKAGPCLSTHGGEVELSALWHGRRLTTGDLVEVAVLRAGYKGKLFPYVIRSSGPPRPPAIRCLAPGSSEQTQAC